MERDSKLAPDNADIFYHLGLLRYTLGDYDKADAAFQQGVRKGAAELRLPDGAGAAAGETVRAKPATRSISRRRRNRSRCCTK